MKGGTGNACQVDEDCGDGSCVSGVCAAKSNTIEYVMVEISPPVGVGSGEYGNVRYLRAREIGSDRVLDFALDVVAELSIAVAPPAAGCTAAGLDEQGYLPIAVKAYVDSGIHGIAASTIEGSSAATPAEGVQDNTVTVALAPGQIDLYIAPSSEGSAIDPATNAAGQCDLAPFLARGQTIQPEDLPLEVTGRATATPARAGDGVGGRDAERVAERTGWTRARRPPPPRDEVMAALESHRWRVAETSSALQVSRTTLWRWMRELGLER